MLKLRNGALTFGYEALAAGYDAASERAQDEHSPAEVFMYEGRAEGIRKAAAALEQ